MKVGKIVSMCLSLLLPALLYTYYYPWLYNKINKPIKKYNPTINGTRLEVTLTIFFKPPKMTKELIRANIIPVINFH